jgi:tetratricopeptide (TPR) repeat protein
MTEKKQSPVNAGSTDRLELPAAPASETGAVKAWEEAVIMRTYAPEAPERNPMFLEKRVYQGSSGRVYPLPFIDRIATESKQHSWRAIHLENEFIRLMVLPEIGGRIHVGLDKTNGYDFFYRQNVIKPALVGLAGPWISGGVEFNWPQHHRPATFMPVEVEMERHPDGSVTVWCSDHDPMARMKGMHGVCLHPEKAYLELKVRLYNRTQYVQTFLWWANVATRVHDKYQSFFPDDVRFVADHAKRAITSFPLSDRPYYGIDYAERARSGVPTEEQPPMFVPDGSYPANDLSWYSNIPVPTSYMITGTGQDFFGGYDHAGEAGVVHVANHHIAPGKKQWTWGNHEFGYAWDRSLTDSDGPYIELMAGVYTDNQPDFSFLAPGETKTFSQFWFPIRKIGPPQAANLDAAVSLSIENRIAKIGVCATRPMQDVKILLKSGELNLAKWIQDLSVSMPFQANASLPEEIDSCSLAVFVEAEGREIIRCALSENAPADAPTVATEPGLPEEIQTNEELYLTGLHLEQYRHATRNPEIYWREALRRDEGDSRSNNALGLWHLRRGEFADAERHFRASIARLTQLNPNPYDSEPYYNLGLALRFQEKEKEAYAAFYKATWNASWRAPAYYALAELDAGRSDWKTALDHVQRSLRADSDHLNGRNLAAMVLRNLGRLSEADALLKETHTLDALDVWSRFLSTGQSPKDNQQALDLAFDLARAGFLKDALDILGNADVTQYDGTAPIVLYSLAYFQAQLGETLKSTETYRRAAQTGPDYCFPNRLEEFVVLKAAIASNAGDTHAPYYLGNFFYDRRRYEEAVAQWENSVRLDATFPTAWRNLGIAYFNVRHDEQAALNAFDRAFAANPNDGRVLYERDQLWKRIGESPERRLAVLERFPELTSSRDDLAVELATLLNQTGQPEKALRLLTSRKFQPWEGGEGLVLTQFVRSNLLLGQRALAAHDPFKACELFTAALHVPYNLSEAKHLLANQSDVYFWIGKSYADEGNQIAARESWLRAARQRGDFQQMSVRSISEMTFWSAMAQAHLGDTQRASEMFRGIYAYSLELERQTPQIDYFATSLPAMLLFEDDLSKRNVTAAKFLRAQSLFGLHKTSEAEVLLLEVLQLDKNHMGAADLIAQESAFVSAAKAQ